MSVSEDLLCSFELLKPLDNAALKKEMARGRRRASAAAQDAAAAAGTTAGANGATAAVP
jgi:serine/threonine-protein phosphatase PP1 catalytic subunit